MKTPTTLITASMLAALAVTGSAFAAGGGSSSDSGTTGGGAAANGVYPAPTQGVEQGATATGDTGSTPATHRRSHTRHHARKPMNDTTNTPGADASSDTKGN